MTNPVSTKSEPISALHAAATAYPGGIAQLARVIGRSPGVLHNKFSEADERYDVMDREADALAAEIRAKTGDTSYIEAKCARHGGIFVPLPESGSAADDDVLAEFLEIMRRFGEMGRELTEARADGVITLEEFTAFEVCAKRAQAQIHKTVLTLKTQVKQVSQAEKGMVISVKRPNVEGVA
jgi:hypothetical protein